MNSFTCLSVEDLIPLALASHFFAAVVAEAALTFSPPISLATAAEVVEATAVVCVLLTMIKTAGGRRRYCHTKLNEHARGR